MRTAALFAVTSLFAFLPVRATAQADWFATSGVKILEAIGTSDLGYILLAQDDRGGFRLLREGDSFEGKFTVGQVGTEQVRLEDSEGKPSVAPILHQNVPVDMLLLAVGALHQRNVVIGGTSDVLKPFDSELLVDPQKLADLAKEAGLDVRVLEDALLVKKGVFAADPVKFEATPDDSAESYDWIRSDLKGLITKASQGPMALTAEGDTATIISVRAPYMPPRALAHYLAQVTGTKITAAAPEAAKPVAVTAASAPKELDAKGQKVLARARTLLAGGKFAPAFKLFRYLHKTQGARAPFYNGMAICLWKLGKKPQAVKAWNLALEQDPGNAVAGKALGKVKEMVAARRAAATMTAVTGSATATPASQAN